MHQVGAVQLTLCVLSKQMLTWQGSGQPGKLRKGEAAISPALNFCCGSATGPPLLAPRAAEISPEMRLRPSADLQVQHRILVFCSVVVQWCRSSP